MASINEQALLAYCYAPLRKRGISLETKISVEQLTALQSVVAEVLSEQSPDKVERTETLVPATDYPALRSIVGRESKDGKTVKVFTFALRDAAYDSALPLLGIALTVFTGIPSLALIPQSAAVAKTLWSKMIVLERPKDEDAIDVLETLVVRRAELFASGSEDMPKSCELMDKLQWTIDRTKPALSKLYSRKIIQAKLWGGQQDDFAHGDTQWQVAL